MPELARAALLAAFFLAGGTWIGGYVAIAVVARVATRTLATGQRVSFFRSLGRSYLWVGVPALLIALVTGAVLLGDHPWDVGRATVVAAAAALIVTLGVGVAQARRMTRLRAVALRTPDDPRVAKSLRRGSVSAALLRATIGVLSLALVALGSVLAT